VSLDTPRTQELHAVVQHCARARGTEKTVYHHHRVSVEGLDQTVDEQRRRRRRREKRREKRRQKWRQERWQRVDRIVRRALTAGVSVVITVALRALVMIVVPFIVLIVVSSIVPKVQAVDSPGRAGGAIAALGPLHDIVVGGAKPRRNIPRSGGGGGRQRGRDVFDVLPRRMSRGPLSAGDFLGTTCCCGETAAAIITGRGEVLELQEAPDVAEVQGGSESVARKVLRGEEREVVHHLHAELGEHGQLGGVRAPGPAEVGVEVGVDGGSEAVQGEGKEEKEEDEWEAEASRCASRRDRKSHQQLAPWSLPQFFEQKSKSAKPN
jgi:hypothetical protein